MSDSKAERDTHRRYVYAGRAPFSLPDTTASKLNTNEVKTKNEDHMHIEHIVVLTELETPYMLLDHPKQLDSSTLAQKSIDLSGPVQLVFLRDFLTFVGGGPDIRVLHSDSCNDIILFFGLVTIESLTQVRILDLRVEPREPCIAEVRRQGDILVEFLGIVGGQQIVIHQTCLSRENGIRPNSRVGRACSVTAVVSRRHPVCVK